MVAELEQVDEIDESECHVEKLNAKEVILRESVEFNIPNCRWKSENLSEEIRF